MKENEFVVDLGPLKLTDDQRQRMNSAIQKAVAGELATMNVSNNIALLPISNLANAPFIYGLIVRDFGTRFSELIK